MPSCPGTASGPTGRPTARSSTGSRASGRRSRRSTREHRGGGTPGRGRAGTGRAGRRLAAGAPQGGPGGARAEHRPRALRAPPGGDEVVDQARHGPGRRRGPVEAARQARRGGGPAGAGPDRGGLGFRLLGGRIVVVWGRPAIREVLDQSADVYASDSGAKAKGMAHFQPEALTLSRGEDWRDRREFNESVLATSERVHPFGGRFVTLAAEEVGRLQLADSLDWDHWERLFDRLTLRMVFGDRASDDQELTQLLEKLLAEANRLPGPGANDTYYEFYGRLERYLQDP